MIGEDADIIETFNDYL